MLDSLLFKWLFVLTGPVISFLFIVIKEPMGLRLFSNDFILTLALSYSISLILIWVLHLFVIQDRIIKSLNLLTTVVWLAWISFFIGIFNYVFFEVYLFKSQFDFYYLPEVLKYSMGFGLTLVVIFLATYTIKKRLFQG